MINKNLAELRAKVDSFTDRVLSAYADDVVCARGCTDCCLTDISVFPVEADAVLAAFRQLPEATRARLRERAARGDNCVFLLDGGCAVYQERPIICRSQGLPLLLEGGKHTVCQHNFRNRVVEKLPSETVLNLTTLNTLLSITHRLDIAESGQPDQRTRLADLVAETAPLQ